VIARQRPGTAKGFVFLSLEDETGFQCHHHSGFIPAEPVAAIDGTISID
jgi:hypothetical protein